MKKLILLTMILSTVNVFAGVKGDKIHFQKQSTWVSAAFSKSLCLNDENVYEADIRLCTEYSNDRDDRRCISYGIFHVYQPMESTRQRCKRRGGDDENRCIEWETVPYIQNRVKTVQYTRDTGDGNDEVYKTEIIRIPDCN